jgi:phospholipid/cholesterol/gamma-HCH transport system substrate-binding protein
MAKKAVEFKVGLAVIVAIILLLASVFWLQGYQFRKSFIKLKVSFVDVGGLKRGDPVSVSGVNKGKVAEVTLTRESVLTTLNVERDSYIYDDATFTVKNYGLMGERFVYIDPGESRRPIDCSRTYQGLTDPGTSELIGLFGETIKDVRQVLADIRRTVASESNLNNLTDIVTTLSDVTVRLNKFLGENSEKIDRTFTNLENVSDNLGLIIDSNALKIDTALNNFTQASVNLNRLTDSLEVIASSLSNFLQKVDEGEGTLGLLGADETLYQDVKKMVRSVETIIEDIRRDPKKYLNVEVKVF